MNDLDLPPHRSLPTSVRDRMRARLDGPDTAERAASRRSRGPLAVAAGVAVLAAGAVMIAQSVTGASGGYQPGEAPPATTTTPSDTTMDRSAMDGVLNTCLTAVAGQGYPPREAWRPVLGAREHGVTVVMARAQDKPYVCQLTATSVTMSNPAGDVPRSQDTTAGLLLNTPEGVVAGVAERAWKHVGVLAVDGENVMTSTVAHTRDGLFFLVRGSEEAVAVRLYNAVDGNENPPSFDSARPQGPEAATVTVVDRHSSVAPEDQAVFDACAAANPNWDAENWSPAAGMVWHLDGRVVLLRNRYSIAVCRHDAKPADGREYTVTQLGSHERDWTPCRLAALTPSPDAAPLVGGVVTPEAAYVDIWFHDDARPIRKAVVNGTFLVQTPRPGAQVEKVDVYGNDALRHTGPLDAC